MPSASVIVRAGAALAVVAAVLPAHAASNLAVAAAKPTALFVRTAHALEQQADVTFTAVPGRSVTVTAVADGRTAVTAVDGRSATARVGVPDIARPTTVRFRVDGGPAKRLSWRPQRKWTVWLQPSSHVDLYSTTNAQWTPGEHVAAVESALNLLAAHPDYRFQIENGLPVEQFLQLRPNERGRLAAALRSGRLAVGGQYTGVHQDEASDESLVQAQYAYRGVRDALDSMHVKPDAGIVYDVPSVTPQMPQVLRQAGLKYFLFSPNHSYALYERMHLPWLFRWRAPDGSTVLTWRAAWNYGYEKNQYYHLQDGVTAAAPVVDRMLLDRQRCLYRDPYGAVFGPRPEWCYPFHDLLMQWDYGDNTAADAQPIEFVHQWNRTYAYPRFRFTTFGEFMDHMSRGYDPALIPTRSGEVLDPWTYLVAAQGLINEWTRAAKRDLPAAQTWCAFGALLGGRSCRNRDIVGTWSDIGKTEAHDWFYGSIPIGRASGLPVPDPHLPLPLGAGDGNVPDFMVPDVDKAAWGRSAAAAAAGLESTAARTMAARVASGGAEVVVLNNGTTTRSDLVAIPATDRHVVDEATGREVPTQRIPAAQWASGLGARPTMALYARKDAAAQPTADVTVFVAPDVPGLGYTRFRLSDRPGRRPRMPRVAPYTVGFDPATGAVQSIRHRGRELVDPRAPWGLGEPLLGAPATDFGDIFDTPQPIKQQAQRLSATSMSTVVGGFPGAVAPPTCGQVLCTTEVVGTIADEHRTMVVVTYRSLDRVDVIVTTAFDKAKQERIYLAMPLAGSPADVSYGEPFAAHHVGRDDAAVQPSVQRQLTDWIEVGAGHGHATAMTSTDFGPFVLGRPDVNLMTHQFTVPQHPWWFPILVDTTAGSVADFGTYVARFSIASGDAGIGPRLAVSSREPLTAVVVDGPRRHPLPAAMSLLRVTGGAVTAVKTAATGRGLIVRVLADGGPVSVRPAAVLRLGQPRRSDLLERIDGRAARVVEARRYQIVTLYLPVSQQPAGAP